jgi:hypothetical protein
LELEDLRIVRRFAAQEWHDPGLQMRTKGITFCASYFYGQKIFKSESGQDDAQKDDAQKHESPPHSRQSKDGKPPIIAGAPFDPSFQASLD